jgi:hypothetical protein
MKNRTKMKMKINFQNRLLIIRSTTSPAKNMILLIQKNGQSTKIPETPVNNKNSFSVFRLPKLDLQPFDGDSKKWTDWIAIYIDLVHQNSSISTTQKMAIVKQCLTQDIRDGLGDSLSSPALYDKALRELEETYGHPQQVSRSYIQSLTNLPKLNMNDYKSLMKASQNINGSVALLKSGGYEKELYSVTLMELAHSKMPPDIQSRWGKKISKNHPRWVNLQDFADWLHSVVKGEMMAKHCQLKIEKDQQQKQKMGRQKDPGVRFPPKINTILPPQQQGNKEGKAKEKDQAENHPKKLPSLPSLQRRSSARPVSKVQRKISRRESAVHQKFRWLH